MIGHPIFTLPAVAGIIVVSHHAQHFSAEMGSWELDFCMDWPGTLILLISTS
jgi:hypothetical protein